MCRLNLTLYIDKYSHGHRHDNRFPWMGENKVFHFGKFVYQKLFTEKERNWFHFININSIQFSKNLLNIKLQLNNCINIHVIVRFLLVVFACLLVLAMNFLQEWIRYTHTLYIDKCTVQSCSMSMCFTQMKTLTASKSNRVCCIYVYVCAFPLDEQYINNW